MTAKRRTIRFFEAHPLEDVSIQFVQGVVGLYFIFLESLRIPYPFNPSRLIYIGVSESRQNTIGNRLRDHRSGRSGNVAIANYAARHQVRFTYHPIEVLRVLGTHDLFQLEGFFLAEFLRDHGAYPLCNNQSGICVERPVLTPETVAIAWDYFA